jgi:hypothetical protein
MYTALREKNSISIRNWKKDHTDFNEFVLGTATKRDIETNGLLPGEDMNEDTAGKSKDFDLDGVDGDTDDNCDGIYDDDDTDSNCDGNDDNNCHGEDDDNNTDDNCDGIDDDDDTDSNCDDNDDEIDDDDTDSKCNIIDDNNRNKCMSSIHNRDDEMRYYHMCVGFGAHLKRKMCILPCYH